MKVYEIGTGYTPIPAAMGAATEIVVEELTKAFQKLGVPVEIIDIKAADRRPNQLPISEVWVPGCFAGTDVKLGIMHKLKRVVYSLCLARKLKGILKNTQEKVVLHFHNQYNMFFFLKLTSKKLREKAVLAYTVHSYIWHGCWEQIQESISKRYFQEVFSLEHADHVFVLNNQTRDNIVQHVKVDADKVQLIDNGVNTEVYHPLSAQEKQQLKEAQRLSGKRVFVQVGSVCERKNQLQALRLLTPLMKKDHDTVFWYAGGVIDPEYQKAIEDYAAQNGIQDQIHYAGELPPGKQINDFYNLAEAMVFPSKAEGFSLVIVEAMAAGLPVLISDQLHFPLEHECIRYTDENSFLDSLEKQVLSDGAEQMKAKVRAMTEEHFGWTEIGKKYSRTWSKEHA